MNPIVEKVYQIGIIPVIAFNSVDEALPLCKALADGGLPAAEVEKQCLFFADPAQMPQALARFRAVPGIEVVQGAPENLEVTAAGVDKGSALLALADRLGIPHEQTLAVGDSENDRAMLEKAGIAAVMANGMPHIKALGDLVTEHDCDHDGVAEVFARLGL